MTRLTNVWPLPAEDEEMIREHHLTDAGYERCVICRLLATIDDLRERIADSNPGSVIEARREP